MDRWTRKVQAPAPSACPRTQPCWLLEPIWCLNLIEELSALSRVRRVGDPWTSISHLTVLAVIIQEAREMKLWATFQHQALCFRPYSHIFLTAGLYCFLLTLIFKGCSTHYLNVLVPALLLESSQQCHSPVRCVWLQSHSVLHIQQATSATLSKCPRISSWLLQGKYEFVVVVCPYWVLYLWWLMDLRFNILETFHFTWQICYML